MGYFKTLDITLQEMTTDNLVAELKTRIRLSNYLNDFDRAVELHEFANDVLTKTSWVSMSKEF